MFNLLSSSKNWLKNFMQIFRGRKLQKKNFLDKLKDVTNQEIIDDEVAHIIEGAVNIAEMQARDIMIPRSQMVCIVEDEQPADFLPRIIAAGHSRYPVTGESMDEIHGLLLAKDLLPLLLSQTDNTNFNLKSILRPAIFVPESKRLTVLLRDFRTNKNHMAVIADEYGGVAGLVTIEDILEEIVGDIEDEYDDECDAFIKSYNKNEFMVKALTPVEYFNNFFHSNLSDEDFDTIGGLVMQELGHMPKHNESVRLDKFKFKVVKSNGRRIQLLYVSIQN